MNTLQAFQHKLLETVSLDDIRELLEQYRHETCFKRACQHAIFMAAKRQHRQTSIALQKQYPVDEVNIKRLFQRQEEFSAAQSAEDLQILIEFDFPDVHLQAELYDFLPSLSREDSVEKLQYILEKYSTMFTLNTYQNACCTDNLEAIQLIIEKSPFSQDELLSEEVVEHSILYDNEHILRFFVESCEVSLTDELVIQTSLHSDLALMKLVIEEYGFDLSLEQQIRMLAFSQTSETTAYIYDLTTLIESKDYLDTFFQKHDVTDGFKQRMRKSFIDGAFKVAAEHHILPEFELDTVERLLGISAKPSKRL